MPVVVIPVEGEMDSFADKDDDDGASMRRCDSVFSRSILNGEDWSVGGRAVISTADIDSEL